MLLTDADGDNDISACSRKSKDIADCLQAYGSSRQTRLQEQVSENSSIMETSYSFMDKLKRNPILSLHADSLISVGLTEEDVREASEEELVEFAVNFLAFNNLAAKKCAILLKKLL